MVITDVRLKKVSECGKLKAVASITIDDEFVIHELKVIEGTNGLFVSMPCRKNSSGLYVDIAHPIKIEIRKEIEQKVLEKYNNVE